MSRQSGFTIVELVIVMVIMTILLVVGTVSFSSLQAKSRDNERSNDVVVIARALETRYKEGNSVVTSPSYVAKGSYPSVAEMQHIFGASQPSFSPTQVTGGYATDVLLGTSSSTFLPPGVSSNGLVMRCTSSCGVVEDYASIAAMTTKDTYVYEPINASNSACLTGECTRFNLYWRTETATPDPSLPISGDTTFHRQRSSRQ